MFDSVGKESRFQILKEKIIDCNIFFKVSTKYYKQPSRQAFAASLSSVVSLFYYQEGREARDQGRKRQSTARRSNQLHVEITQI